MKSEAKAALAAGATAVFMAVGPLSGEAKAEPMVSSWYGPGLEGNLTASGEIFNSDALTAAHPSLPFGTKLLVSYGGSQTVARVNDRGPFVSGRGLDLSRGAAEAIGLTGAGADAVDVQVLGDSADSGTLPAKSNSSASSEAPGQTSSAWRTPRSLTGGSDKSSSASNQRSSNKGSEGIAGFLRERPYLRLVGAAFTPYSRPSKSCQEASMMAPTLAEETRLPSVETTRMRVAAAAPCSARTRAT